MNIPLDILLLAVIVVLAVVPIIAIFYHYLKERKTKAH